MDWASQRLSGRKVDWGWGGVGGAAALGCVTGAAGAWLGEVLSGAKGLGSCAANSFTADTLVKMADGTRKRIADVRVGDRVLAADEDSPDSAPRSARVATVITGLGSKKLVDVSVAGGKPITATEGHPFWVPSRHQWVTAGELVAGDWLRTSVGTFVQVTAVAHRSGWERVYNLTVGAEHTYFVLASGNAVLVHNCGGKIRNSGLAGQNHPRTGVPFDEHGFPDFSNWRHPDVPDVRIGLTGDRGRDFARANEAAGLASTPRGYTWHHHQDPGLMQLVETWTHNKTGHTGGFSIWNWLRGS
jgi:hypothetical protein